jgi:hypothetical protein
MFKRSLLVACLISSLFRAQSARATETENLGIRILPAPGKVEIDGEFKDWDLSGGVFACGDVENVAATYGVWVHAMYDKDNLYLLARWVDATPMNNPGTSKGDYGFRGDCLQVRVVTDPDVTGPEVNSTERDAKDGPKMRTTHMTAWRDKDGYDVIDIEYGRNFNEGSLKDAKKEGGAQAFAKWPNGKGYTQEMRIPWKLLTKPGIEVKPGSQILITFEPNFTVGTGGRLTIKDVFKRGVPLDRVFTFSSNQGWGYGSLETKGHVELAPVRLSDNREFAVKMDNGVPAVDWTGLTKSRMPDGFKSIKITMAEDGYASLNIFAPDGTVVRQLLTNHFLTKGDHEIKWDGLTTASLRIPGKAVSAGDYTWEGVHHTGIGMRLRGWADNSGSAPWYGWGADHGNPIAAAAAGNQVFLGWAAGEGDKPLQACDLNGNIQWKNIRGGIAGAGPIAADGTTVYVYNGIDAYAKKAIYRVDSRTGQYSEWSSVKSTDLAMTDLWPDLKNGPDHPTAIAAAGGKVFVSFDAQDAVLVVNAESGKVEKKIDAPKAAGLAALSDKEFYVYCYPEVRLVNAETGETKKSFKPRLENKDWVTCIAADKEGNVYAGIRGETHQVDVYSPDGKFIRTLGRKGGRALLGKWTPDGMLNVSGIAVDAEGKLWVAEDDTSPKRISVWDTQTGAFKTEYFGSSSYGAIGSNISPVDPYVMVGQGAEWRIDPKTARAVCLGVVTREGMGNSRFGFGPGGKRLYLATSAGFLGGSQYVAIYERIGDANYKLRAKLTPVEKAGPDGKKIRVTEVWSDANDDGVQQPDEVKTYDLQLGGWISGWYMPMTPDMTFYGSLYQVKVTGWTKCGAPLYDISQAKKMPGPADAGSRGGMGAEHGHGSADNKFMLWNSGYGDDHSTLDCYDIATGQRVWSYPSNYTGVHGSHRAGTAQVGLIRGGYDICGSAKIPVVGNIWVVPTNKGEWHVLTEKGYYLTHLFQGDPTKMSFPDQAVPGASLDTCPPGAGEEAFGGSITQQADGSLSVQAGHVSYWNAEVVGLDTIKPLPGGKISITNDDVAKAQTFRDQYLQEASTVKRLVAKKATPAFTGDLKKDFADAKIVKYEKEAATAVQTAVAWDDQNLYVGWEVKDGTPWINGADAPEFMYARGDTVDLQMGADPAAPADRRDGVLGDFRLSIGSYHGKATAVIYRKIAAEKHPRSFVSGTVKDYPMESVVEMKDVKIEVKIDQVTKRYIIEAALPLSALGIAPKPGLVLHADFGATHSNKTGDDTALRTYWSNQSTGLVSDEVGELQMTPSAWGELLFK